MSQCIHDPVLPSVSAHLLAFRPRHRADREFRRMQMVLNDAGSTQVQKESNAQLVASAVDDVDLIVYDL